MSLIFVSRHIRKGNFQEIEELPLKQMAMVVDIDRCIGCHGCEVACFIEKRLPESVRLNPLIRLETEIKGAFSLLNFSLRCAHCETPKCMLVCPSKAYNKNSEGFVTHTVGRCIGCQLCQVTCPYGAPKYNPDNGKVKKCDFCIGRVKRGKDPACVSKCIMKAFRFGKLSDQMEMLVKKASEGAGVLVLENREPVIDLALSACFVG